MRKALIIGSLLAGMYLLAGWQGNPPHPFPSETLRKWLLNELEEARQDISKSLPPRDSIAHLKHLYHDARMHYKHVEFFVEYCSPREAKYTINGPLVFKQWDESNIAIPPCGFQRIEELLFSDGEKCDTAELHKQYRELFERLGTLSSYYQNIEISETSLLEMCQLQLFRIASMNLSGYDATISQTNVTESSWCLEGLDYVLRSFKPAAGKNGSAEKTYRELITRLSSAKKYLYAHPDYDSFNRLEFIVNCINPLDLAFVRFHSASGIGWNGRAMALNLKNGFLFGKESINRQFFSMYYDDTLHISQQAQLGKLLFFDPVLSGNNKRACASCHNPSKAFTDGHQTSTTFGEEGHLARNAPGLLNVIYQKAFFDDGRAYQLEQQIFDVVHNEKEMQSNLEDVVSRLRKSSEYKKIFSSAFKGSGDSVITQYAIQKAIAEYEKTLVSFNSRFDKYLHGDFKQLNKREVDGYNLFAGKALCGSCHFLPLFNSTVPPFYNENEYEVIGTPSDSGNKQLDPDQGRYTVTHLPEQKNAFKTPTVRNVELTAPYMHNGIYTSLEQVVEFYHRGGGAGFKIDVPNQTLPFDSLKMSMTEKENIVLFLKTLTDTVGTTSRPVALPLFEDNALLSKRKIGGEY